MNVACTACPAKYAVPDDRVRGKRARITCKHCGTAIIIDGTGLGPSSQPLKPEPGRQIRHTLVELPGPNAPARAPAMLALKSNPAAAPARAPSPSLSGVAPRPAAGVSANAAAAAPSVPTQAAVLPSAAAPATAPPSGTAESALGASAGAWLVALPDGRREPASLARIVDLFASGTLDDSTYVWRDGMPEWKSPRSIPEIAQALTVRQSAPAASQAPFAKPREYEEEEATRVAISPMDLALGPPPNASPPAPSDRGGSRAPLPQLPAASGANISAREPGPPSNPPPSKRPAQDEPVALRSSPDEDIVARSRGVATLRKKSSPSAAPPPPPRDPAPMPPGRPVRRTLPPGAISIPLAGSDLLTRVPAPTPAPPQAEPMAVAPAALASPPRGPQPELEGPPRSAAPVSVPLSFPVYPYPESKNRTARWVGAGLAAVVLAGVGAGYATNWRFAPAPAAPPPPATQALAKTPPVEPDPTPAPSASAEEAPSPTAAPSAAAEPNAPEPEANRQVAAASRARVSASRNHDKPNKAANEKSEPAATEEPVAAANAEEKPAAEAKEGSSDAAVAAEGPPFDRDAAAAALGDAATRAQSCAKLGGPTGTGSVTITFGTNGQVTAASVGGDYAGTSVGACVVKLFRSAKVPAFGGQPIAVSKRFSID